jgi:hypothetical protein
MRRPHASLVTQHLAEINESLFGGRASETSKELKHMRRRLERACDAISDTLVCIEDVGHNTRVYNSNLDALAKSLRRIEIVDGHGAGRAQDGPQSAPEAVKSNER